jgi:glycosyltransferase involved in cell wall biosynthesis
MILIDSLYINNSGGLGLLNYLIDEIEKTEMKVLYLIDTRNKTSYSHIQEERIIRLKATLKNRNQFYQNEESKFTKVLCLGKIATPFRLSNVNVYTYLHHYFYLDTSTSKKTFISKFKFALKKYYFKLLSQNTDLYIVQSHHMAEELTRVINGVKQVQVIPFYKSTPKESIGSKNLKDFVYVSNANPHKNHEILLDAWSEVNQHSPESVLHLTVSKEMYPVLCDRIGEMGDVNVVNHGLISGNKVTELLNQTEFLVYPSLAESFGLVLIEAAQAKCKIISSHMPYVYSVVEPSLTFDPYDQQSISDAMIIALEGTGVSTQLKTKNEIESMLKLLASK